jgi:hypothetical protein
MYSVHISNGRSKPARSKENAPQEAGDQEMVARDGIDQGRGCRSYISQGQSKALLLTPTSGS